MATDTLTSPVFDGSSTHPAVYKNFIDGEWVETSNGQTFENRNPADTRDLVGIFQKSAKADVDAAVDAAKRAFVKWRLVPAPRRAEIIYRAAEILSERKEEYARDMTREMGKVLKETRGDVQEAVDTAYYMAGEGRRLFGPTTPSELPNKFAMAMRTPIGVCGMLLLNFPNSSWKRLPWFAATFCVIKPGGTSLVRSTIRHPEGVVNIVTDAA
jgi:aldehyde dehydrogenase (NAD+)